MIKLFSAVDILTLPEFSGFTVFDLINRKNDGLVASLLYPLGVDKDKDVEVFPCRHKKVSGEEVVNYAYVFWERQDRAWLQCPHSTMSARIEAVTDGELKAEMLRLSHDSASMKFRDDAISGQDKRGLIVDTFEEDKELIKTLKKIMKEIR